MSHALGEILSLDKENHLGWFEYNGTCDVCCTRVYETEELADAHWRGDNKRVCIKPAEHPQTEVILYTHYGGGFHWLGKVCFVCEAITHGIVPGYLDGDPRG